MAEVVNLGRTMEDQSIDILWSCHTILAWMPWTLMQNGRTQRSEKKGRQKKEKEEEKNCRKKGRKGQEGKWGEAGAGGALAGFLGQWVFGTAFGIVALLAVYRLSNVF